ncbi:MAG: ABC transporter ATP-binding protein, partial [Syntrophomonadaceae bacterium]|nr:ABC transporter ATP-binding protein [Syntrophomonadaceae bacterium]
MLRCVDIDVYYGAIHALKKLSIEVEQGSIVTLI